MSHINHEQQQPRSILDQLLADQRANINVITYKINNFYADGNTIIEADTLIEPIFLNSTHGLKIYQDYIIFIFSMAIFRLWGNTETIIAEHSIGDGIYCELLQQTPNEKILQQLKDEVCKIVEQQIKIERVTLTVAKASEILKEFKRDDVLKNINFHGQRYIELYRAADYFDYYPSLLPPNTACKVVFDLVLFHQGLIIRCPKDKDFQISKKFVLPKLLFTQNQEHDKWLKILKVDTVGDINQLIINHQISEFILTEEALHEKKIASLADHIKEKKTVKFVLIAGPSSSGKTTFAKRLAIQLRVNGFIPYCFGLDDYFLPRAQTPKLPNGDYDFETIMALDIKLINKDLTSLLNGDEITLPRYNFHTGERETSKHQLRFCNESIVIIEGIHALNELLTSSIAESFKTKIYISALNQLNIDHHNRIPTTDCRRIRRIVRDAQFRGYSAEETLKRWPAVREGEESYIFPFQEQADYMFNSSLTYEIGVLKKYVLPLLRAINYQSQVYNDAQDLIALVSHFLDIKDEHVINNSLLREFIAHSLFEY